MIHVIAALSTAPGKRNELIALFKELAPQVRAEEGCIEYGTAIDIPTPLDVQEPLRDDVLVVIERWESVAALEAHLATPHMEQFRKDTADIVTGVSLQVLEPAAE